MRKSLAALKNVYFKAEKIGHKFEKLGHKFLVSKVIKGHKWSQAESADTLCTHINSQKCLAGQF